jgi:hypothetical protein
MADEYYVVYDKTAGRWEVQIPESERRSGSFVLRTFDTKAPAMDYAKKVARNQSARLVENARAGYTMEHYDYTNS